MQSTSDGDTTSPDHSLKNMSVEGSAPYKRGMYKMDESWSNDKTKCYFEGVRMRVVLPLIKACLLIILGFALSHMVHYAIAILICLAVVVSYQEVVARIYGLTTVPVMDYTCFIGGDKSIVNFMNCTWYATTCDPELVKDKLLKAARLYPKMRYKIVEVAGDFYYEEMSEDELISKGLIYNKEGQLKNQRDID